MPLEQLKTAVEQVVARSAHVRGLGESATKQSLVLPILTALGYDVYNPLECVPEFSADFAIKKAGQKEKVDLALFVSGSARVFVEIKAIDLPLDGYEGQLARYFNSTPSVVLGILTNGIEWRFFNDVHEKNLMDLEWFFRARLDAEPNLSLLSSFFDKASFFPNEIGDFASSLVNERKIEAVVSREFDVRRREPSDSLVKWLIKQDIYDGVCSASTIAKFRPMVKRHLLSLFKSDPPKIEEPSIAVSSRERFWDLVKTTLRERDYHVFESVEPKGPYLFRGAGVSGVTYSMVISAGQIRVELYIQQVTKELYDRLYSHRSEIEASYGAELVWSRRDDHKSSRILHSTDLSTTDERNWAEAVEFLSTNIVKLENAFKGRLSSPMLAFPPPDVVSVECVQEQLA
jgi:hypothetical protein